MTVGESLLAELDARGDFRHWDYAARQQLRSADSADALADFLNVHGLENVRVSDDAAQVADGICAAWNAEGSTAFMRWGWRTLFLAVAFIVYGISEGGGMLIAGLVVGGVFVLTATFRFFAARHLKREARRYSHHLT